MKQRQWTLLFAALFTVGALGGAAAWAAKGGKSKKITKGWSMSYGMADSTLGADLASMSGDLRTFFGAPEDQGLLVQQVEPGSAADRAGLKVGDVLIAVDGEKVEEPWDAMGQVAGKQAGDEVKLEVVREKKRVTLSTRLTDDDLDAAGFGIAGPGVRAQIPRMKMHMMRFPDLGNGSFGFSLFDDDLEERLQKLEERLEKLEKKVK